MDADEWPFNMATKRIHCSRRVPQLLAYHTGHLIAQCNKIQCSRGSPAVLRPHSPSSLWSQCIRTEEDNVRLRSEAEAPFRYAGDLWPATQPFAHPEGHSHFAQVLIESPRSH